MQVTALLLLACLLAPAAAAAYTWDTKWFQQRVDHFSYSAEDSGTWAQRYLINTDHWQAPEHGKPAGPILFYTGNEGSITSFAENTGFMWDIAPHYKAAVVFAEHRYYGESFPIEQRTVEDMKYLSTDQALADYATLLTSLRVNMSAPETAVIAFGGSYGGMLTAWMRQKYPNIVAGGIAASAPVLAFPHLSSAEFFAENTTSTFKKANHHCSAGIRRSWDVMKSMAATAEGREGIAEALRLCEPPASAAALPTGVWAWLSGAYAYLAMVDYPYAANFLGPLPAWPVKAACQPFKADMTDAQLLSAVRHAATLYYNSSGSVGSCFNISADTGDTDLGFQSWTYQTCSEMPACPFSNFPQQNGVTDMFWPANFSEPAWTQWCEQNMDVSPRWGWARTNFGGKLLGAATNIVFSNGLLDPWHGGGVLWNVSATVRAILIPEGAHHLDLRGSNPADPESVKFARAFHRRHIDTWLKEWPAAPSVCPAPGPHPVLSNTGIYILSSFLAVTAIAAVVLAIFLCRARRAAAGKTKSYVAFA